MAYESLGDFIAVLDREGELKKVDIPVDPVLEMTEIVDRLCKLPGGPGPAVLFEKPVGSSVPVLINAFGSERRMALALGAASLDEITIWISGLMENLSNVGRSTSLWEHLKVLPKLAGIASIMPKIVSGGPCKEIVLRENFSLFDLPILKCWPGDAGRFITMPLVFTRDPITGVRNVGMYRMQVFDGKTTGMHWHMHKDGAEHIRSVKPGGRLDAAVVIGADPAVVYSATAPLPKGVDEIFFAGFLRRSGVRLVKCETVDIEVPVSSEIVLEGWIDPEENREEGSFGDHTGFYSPADIYPVFHVECITMRREPVYMATVVGVPPMEDAYLGKATERIFLPLIKLQIPEIVDINFPIEGVFHNCVLVSIDKRYPGHAQKVMNAIWGIGQLMFSKVVIVVDKDIDVSNISETAWWVLSSIDPQRDISFTKGPTDPLDHAACSPAYGSKMGIDATRKWPEEGYRRGWPECVAMDRKIIDLVDSRWKEYGF